MIDWNLPVEELPPEIAFTELPPFARALVRRNLKLRQQLQQAEAALAVENIAALKAELEAACQKILSLEESLSELRRHIGER